MDIKDFVKSTVSQIGDAIRELNDESKDDQMVVNPYDVKRHNKDAVTTKSGSITVTDILFDLYVSVESTSESGGKLGVFSGIFDAGVAEKTDDSNKSISRVQFSVPVIFPFRKSVY